MYNLRRKLSYMYNMWIYICSIHFFFNLLLTISISMLIGKKKKYFIQVAE